MISRRGGVANSDDNGDNLQEVELPGTHMNIPDLNDVLDLSIPKAHSTTVGSASDFLPGNVAGHEIHSRNGECSNTDAIGELPTPSENDSLDAVVSQAPFTVIASTSSLAIREINLPSKRYTIGRPKGSSKTVIGTKRKAKATNKKTPSTLSSTELAEAPMKIRIRKRKMDGQYEVADKVTKLRS